jgi:hypothetical protein
MPNLFDAENAETANKDTEWTGLSPEVDATDWCKFYWLQEFLTEGRLYFASMVGGMTNEWWEDVKSNPLIMNRLANKIVKGTSYDYSELTLDQWCVASDWLGDYLDYIYDRSPDKKWVGIEIRGGG